MVDGILIFIMNIPDYHMDANRSSYRIQYVPKYLIHPKHFLNVVAFNPAKNCVFNLSRLFVLFLNVLLSAVSPVQWK